MWLRPSVWWLWCLVVESSALMSKPGHENEFTSHYKSSQEWMTQQLDHMNPTDRRQWKQRYWVNSGYYRRGAPVFLFIGGEWEERDISEELGFPWEENAVNHHALMFKLEHRFYGRSQPTWGDLSLKNLEYLSSTQVLEDLATFIDAMNHQHELPPGTRWVAVGFSYSATLAVWLQHKYPQLVYAVLAYSAPLHVKVPFPEFYNAVDGALFKFYSNLKRNDNQGRACVESYHQAIERAVRMLETPEGVKIIKENFGYDETRIINWNSTSDTDPKLEQDVVNALYLTAATAVQSNKLVEDAGKWTIERFCDTLLDGGGGDIVDRYARIFNTQYSESGPQDLKADMLWKYQCCAEIGLFGAVDDGKSFIGHYLNEEYYFKSCRRQFGERFSDDFIRQRVDNTSRLYGGQDINVSRVIFAYGSLDPWISVGRRPSSNPLTPVVTVEGGSHYSAYFLKSPHDSESLEAAREKISIALKDWLK